MLHLSLEQALREAVAVVLPDADPAALLVRPCPDPKFGDYQTTALMALARERRLNPRQLAGDVLARLRVSDWCERVDIAGGGFLNFRLRPAAIGRTVAAAARGEHLFFHRAERPRTIVIDFSSPNVAKPMHIGHIRSTLLGDCLARALRLLGHRVITDNHIGDWGTQFGMLIVGWKTSADTAALQKDPVAEMERLYRLVNERCKVDPAVRDQARHELVKLQSGDPGNLSLWREMQRLSQAQFDAVYARLGVEFDHTLGESFYNARLPGVVEELGARGIARESEGALAVFSDGTLPPAEDPFLIHRDGTWTPNPALVRKRDGAFNYTTTDLATLAHRWDTWQPDEIVYVTDARQQLHFRQLFAIFRRWRPEAAARMRLEHVWFGSILGEDGTPFKTRSGDTVKLAELLDEAEERAFGVVTAKNPELPEPERRNVARAVGLGAVKYADLMPNRQSDYTFSWDKMLALQGNTAPYLQYAYTRVRGIVRRSSRPETGAGALAGEPVLSAPEELALARHLLNFGLVLQAVAAEHRPNFLCNYLYELAGGFSKFYEACPVLKAESETTRAARLALTEVTGRVLRQGLETLGLEVLEQM